MFFLTDGVSKLSLSIVGCERVGHNSKDNDSWLNIRMDATDEQGYSWSATDPCLLVSELVELQHWLEKFISIHAEPSSIFFLEPKISFFSSPPDILYISLRYNMLPKEGDCCLENERILCMSISRKQILKLINKIIVLSDLYSK